MIDLKVINKEDPLKRNVEKGLEGSELSPMDPPDAYSPPSDKTVPYEEMHSFIQTLMGEHKLMIAELGKLEGAFTEMKEEGISKPLFNKISDFFRFFDDEILEHTRREERDLFRMLHQRLLGNSEHSTGEIPITTIDMMEDDHVKTLQLATIVFNFLGMAMRLPDMNSRLIMLDAAVEQGKAFIELMRLHIFREETITFSQAMEYLTSEEMDGM
jgi:hemerythrin-like domain-containing protein